MAKKRLRETRFTVYKRWWWIRTTGKSLWNLIFWVKKKLWRCSCADCWLWAQVGKFDTPFWRLQTLPKCSYNPTHWLILLFLLNNSTNPFSGVFDLFSILLLACHVLNFFIYVATACIWRFERLPVKCNKLRIPDEKCFN